jgi:hypothetical protein
VEINPVEFRRNIAYVMQDDALLATGMRKICKFSNACKLTLFVNISK